MTPTINGSSGGGNGNGNGYMQDPSCPTTAADRATGGLGMLSYLLRQLVDKLLPPWYYPPAHFQPFDAQGVIATPVPLSGATVLSILVPTGYVMVARRISVNIIGPSFIQGSGTLIWTVSIDNVPVKNYARILTEFGSVQMPRPTDGIIAQSGQNVMVKVQNAAYVAAGTYIAASLGGWFYPTRIAKNAS